MKEFKATTTINAPPEKVWDVLMDTSAYPEWDPYCISIEGSVAPGAQLKAYSTLSPDRTFPVKVTELVPQQKMTWASGMPFGLFKGQRNFVLTPKESGTEFTVREVFTGPMLMFIGGTIPDMNEPFEAFVTGLKNRVEES